MQDNMYGALSGALSAVKEMGGISNAVKAYQEYSTGGAVQSARAATGTAVVPYTGGGAVAPVGGEVQQISPFESMIFILEEMRDGINSIASYTFEMMTYGLPHWQGGRKGERAAEQAARQTGRAETEGGGKSGGIIPSITGAFTGLLPEGGFGDKLKLLAFTGLLWALSKYQDIIIPKLAFVLKKLKSIALWFSKEGEGGEIEIDWTKVLLVGAGAMAIKILAGLVFSPLGMGMAFTGFAKLAPHLVKGAKLLGPAALAAGAIYSAFSIMGDAVAAQDWSEEEGATDSTVANMIGGALGGKMEGSLKNAFKKAGDFAIPFGIAGMALGSFVPVIGNAVGFVIGALVGVVFGAIMGMIGGGKIAKFFESMGEWISEKWNNMVQGFKDLFFDREVTTMVGGKEMKHTQRSKIGAMADSMREFEKSINEWMDNAFEKMFGWIPTKAEMKETWTDMTTKVDDWKKDMTTWFSDMWDKLTGWIPSVADIKAAGGDMLQWTKDIIKDIKLWFWDTSKPQIIGIDLSNLAAAMPSVEDLRNAIFSGLPDWLQPDSIEEAAQKQHLKETKKTGFFDKDWATKSDVDRSKIDQVSAEQLQAILALESDDLKEKDIAWIKEQIKIKTGTDWTTARKLMTSPSASGQALAEVSSASHPHGHPGREIIVDAKSVNSGNVNQKNNYSIDASAQDSDPVSGIVYPRFGSLLGMAIGEYR